MAEEERVEAEEEQPKTEEATEEKGTDLDRIKAELSAEYKKEIAGLNRRNSELERERDELAKEKMGTEERLEYERQQTEAARRGYEEMQASLLRRDIASEFELSSEAASFLTGSDEETIRQNAERLKATIDKETQKGVDQEVTRRFGSAKKPQGGEPATKPTYAELVNMSKEEFAQVSKSVVDEVMEQEMKKE